MNRIAFSIASLGVLAAAACATPPAPVEAYDVTLNRFIGQPETAIIQSWGLPSRKEQLASGGDVLEYIGTDNTGKASCTTLLTTNPNGMIEKFSYTGSVCQSPRQFPPKS
jgi:hypothetical protein